MARPDAPIARLPPRKAPHSTRSTHAGTARRRRRHPRDDVRGRRWYTVLRLRWAQRRIDHRIRVEVDVHHVVRRHVPPREPSARVRSDGLPGHLNDLTGDHRIPAVNRPSASRSKYTTPVMPPDPPRDRAAGSRPPPPPPPARHAR